MPSFSAMTPADIDLATLGREAQTLFDSSMSDYMDDNHDELDGHTQQVLVAFVAGGSSGGQDQRRRFIYLQEKLSDAKTCSKCWLWELAWCKARY